MTKSAMFLSLSASLQVALLAAQQHVARQYAGLWTMFEGFENDHVEGERRQVIVNLISTENGEHIKVFVRLIKLSGTWQKTIVYITKKGDTTVSNQFDITKITYDTPVEEAKYGSKNADMIARLNAGEMFTIYSREMSWTAGSNESMGEDDYLVPYYQFVMLRDGEIMPLPLLCDAAGIDYPDETTPAELVRLFKEKFGEQFIPRVVNDKVEIREMVLVNAGGEVVQASINGEDLSEDQFHIEYLELGEVEHGFVNLFPRNLILAVLTGNLDTLFLIPPSGLANFQKARGNAEKIRQYTIEHLGHWPTELSEVWACVDAVYAQYEQYTASGPDWRTILLDLGEDMVFFHHEGRWAFDDEDVLCLLRNMQYSHGHTYTSWPTDTEEFLRIVRAFERHSVASYDYQRLWPNGRGHDNVTVYVYQDPVSGQTFCPSHKSVSRPSRKIHGDWQTYVSHFKIHGYDPKDFETAGEIGWAAMTLEEKVKYLADNS